MDSLRLEKAYRAWGADINTEVTPLEAGLERFVAFDKGDFVGRAAPARAAATAGPRKRLATLEVDALDADCWGSEAVVGGQIASWGSRPPGATPTGWARAWQWPTSDAEAAAPGTRWRWRSWASAARRGPAGASLRSGEPPAPRLILASSTGASALRNNDAARALDVARRPHNHEAAGPHRSGRARPDWHAARLQPSHREAQRTRQEARPYA